MTLPTAGIDPHNTNFTVGIIDVHGVEITHKAFPNSATGFVEAIELLTTHGVRTVGVEGSGCLGAHVSIALTSAGFDVREVPAQRSATQRRSRRLDKTDTVDSIAVARAVAAEPTLGPAQVMEIYDPLVAKIETVLEQRRFLVESRVLMLHHVGEQLIKLPIEVRDQIGNHDKVESALRRLETLETFEGLTPAGDYRIEWLTSLIDQDRALRRETRRLERLLDTLLDEHGTTLRDEDGIGPIAAATLLCEVGEITRFGSESQFARWCGTGAVELSSGEGTGRPIRHRLDLGGSRTINSTLYTASITQQRYIPCLDRKRAEGKTNREARRAHKRHLANRVIRRMQRDEKTSTQILHPTIDKGALPTPQNDRTTSRTNSVVHRK